MSFKIFDKQIHLPVLLTLTLNVTKTDDDGWPFEVELSDIQPKGTGLPEGEACFLCYKDANLGRLCDACAVEEYVRDIGAEALVYDISLKEGTLVVSGCMDWTWEDGDFNIQNSYWVT